KLDGLPKGATVIVEKTLQKSKADRPAVKGIVPKGERMVTPRKKPAAPAAPKPAAASGGGGKDGPAKSAPKPPAPAAKPAASDHRNTHIPASNGTSKEPAITTIPRPRGEKVRITQFTVHNWVEAVYKAFLVPFPTGVWETATLGVREASMHKFGQDEGDVTKAEKLAREGKTSAEGGNGTAKQARVERERRVAPLVRKRRPIGGTYTKYDDTLYIVWTQSKVNKEQKVEVFQCTIDPHDNSNRGQPYLLEGREYALRPKVHSTYKNTYGGNGNAYRIKDKGARGDMITTIRTRMKRFVTSRADLKNPGKIVAYTDSIINMHFGDRDDADVGDYVGVWSQGCTVLRHGRTSTRYGEFVHIVHRAKAKPHPYLVVSSQYIRLYHEWVAYCDGDKKKAQDPKSVLKLDELAKRKIGDRYVPSVIDVKFAKANPDFVRRALFTVAD
ncbi:MAG TPA: hypothetical protein VE093_29690, partial [Polyangiaceae bacterium]|nr:hypothetical protein [Polyangiaceae bacterium]